MKRYIGGIFAALLILSGAFGATVHASVNDFSFTSFEADYYLGADKDGRSTLKTVEKLVAEFPQSDQNHGIERAIPKKYDGHTTSLKIVSVADESGKTLPYTTYESGNNEVLRIGDASAYVHGSKTYVLTYTQRDVTKLFSDTQRNEFYWDTNGTQWAQSFGSVTARVHIADSLIPTFTKDAACYQGAEGSTQRCQIATDGTLVTARADNLAPGENMTVALGFTPGTFRGYEPSLWDSIVMVWAIVLVVTSVIGFFVIFWLSYKYSRIGNRDKELQPVAPEYIPPKNVSVLVASQLGEGTRAETTAQLIDLAVRHFITMMQIREKTLWRQAEYELKITQSTEKLSDEEREFIRTLFGSEAVGTTLQTKSLKNNYSVASSLRKNTQSLTKRIKTDYGYRHEDKAASAPLKRIGIVLGIIGIVLVSPMVLIAAVVAVVCGYVLRPLTDEGLAVRRYLAGFKEYIAMAEKDRLQALQSPEGAAKTGVSISDGTDKKLVGLYERALPYAILFGQEKEWNKQLAVQYEKSGISPDWYVGHSAFNAAVFTSAMNDFSSSMNSYGASTSSSSGGSTGGGSSGGGGGGGGGGGW